MTFRQEDAVMATGEQVVVLPFQKVYEQSVMDPTKKLGQSSLEARKPFHFIDSCSAIAELVDSLVDISGSTPSIYIDLEGASLSRQGTISILQLLYLPKKYTYLIDVHTLGSNAFSTAGAGGQTLKMIFESETIPKAFFDVRNDSDALYYHFGISLAGVHDIQVMEFATRRVKGKFVSGLSRCIEKGLVLTSAKRKIWLDTKEKGLDLFDPKRGGSYELLNNRPLPDDLCLYCVQDVQYLPLLWSAYYSKLNPNMLKRVKTASADRVKLSQSETYNGHGQHKAIGPW